MTTPDEELGPIDYLIIEFPGNKMTGEGMSLLLDLVDQGTIRVLDLVFITKREDGSVVALELEDADETDSALLTVFEGASSGLLEDGDIAEAAQAVARNCSAGIIIYENLWAAPLAAALRRGGAQFVAGGRISALDVVAALDEQDGRAVNA